MSYKFKDLEVNWEIMYVVYEKQPARNQLPWFDLSMSSKVKFYKVNWKAI